MLNLDKFYYQSDLLEGKSVVYDLYLYLIVQMKRAKPTVSAAHFGNRLFTILKILKWDVDGILFTENVSRYVVIFSAKYFLLP